MKKGTVIDKNEFLKNASYAKEQYENLIVACNPESGEEYSIGIELGDGRVVVVDTVSHQEVREKVQGWAAQVENIRDEYTCTYNPT